MFHNPVPGFTVTVAAPVVRASTVISGCARTTINISGIITCPNYIGTCSSSCSCSTNSNSSDTIPIIESKSVLDIVAVIAPVVRSRVQILTVTLGARTLSSCCNLAVLPKVAVTSASVPVIVSVADTLIYVVLV